MTIERSYSEDATNVLINQRLDQKKRVIPETPVKERVVMNYQWV
jgi:hypothetical protein